MSMLGTAFQFGCLLVCGLGCGAEGLAGLGIGGTTGSAAPLSLVLGSVLIDLCCEIDACKHQAQYLGS